MSLFSSVFHLLAIESSDTGPLAPLVIGAGWLISAALAIGLAWRGRTKWEPAEQDLSSGPAKVSGLLCAVILGIMWVSLGGDRARVPLVWIASVTAALSVVALALYGYLIAVYVYDRLVSKAPNESEVIKIVGGFKLSPAAQAKLAERPDLTPQELLKGAQYDPDKVWSRQSRALAKMSFTLSYIALTALGTVALAAAAMLVIK